MPVTHGIGITIPYRVGKALIRKRLAWFTHQDLVALPGVGSREVSEARLVCHAHHIRSAAIWRVATGV